MTIHNFALILDGADIHDDAVLDALYEAGCDDAMFGATAGLPSADFDREAPTFASAVLSAIRAVEGAARGLRVVRVEPDELVNAADIAERTGRSRESVRLLVEGARGPGHFPPPAFRLHGRQPIWHWSDVAHWFHHYDGMASEEIARAEFLAALNAALELRHHAAHIEHPDERAALAQVVGQTTV